MKNRRKVAQNSCIICIAYCKKFSRKIEEKTKKKIIYLFHFREKNWILDQKSEKMPRLNCAFCFGQVCTGCFCFSIWSFFGKNIENSPWNSKLIQKLSIKWSLDPIWNTPKKKRKYFLQQKTPCTNAPKHKINRHCEILERSAQNTKIVWKKNGVIEKKRTKKKPNEKKSNKTNRTKKKSNGKYSNEKTRISIQKKSPKIPFYFPFQTSRSVSIDFSMQRQRTEVMNIRCWNWVPPNKERTLGCVDAILSKYKNAYAWTRIEILHFSLFSFFFYFFPFFKQMLSSKYSE